MNKHQAFTRISLVFSSMETLEYPRALYKLYFRDRKWNVPIPVLESHNMLLMLLFYCSKGNLRKIYVYIMFILQTVLIITIKKYVFFFLSFSLNISFNWSHTKNPKICFKLFVLNLVVSLSVDIKLSGMSSRLMLSSFNFPFILNFQQSYITCNKS